MSRLPPAEKLPLALRKNLRDEWESKKADFEKELSDLLGVEWTTDINPNALYPYTSEGYSRDSMGSCIASYVENAISRLKDFDSNYGDEGKAELNAICSAHVLTLDVDEAKRFSYCGCDVTEDGKLRILFAPGYMGTNIYDALAPAVLLKALNDAPGSTGDGKPMSYAARTGIRLEWTEKIGETHKKLAEILGKSVDEVKIEPSFEATFEVLSKESKRKGNSLRDDWQSIIGDFTRRYYEGLAYQMEYQKFGEDELLREGFHESVSTGEIVFRIVDKLKYDSYGEVVVEDGRLYIQCKPDTFGTNVDYCAQKLVDQL